MTVVSGGGVGANNTNECDGTDDDNNADDAVCRKAISHTSSVRF